MANASTGNIYYFDAASASISITNIRVIGIIVHCTDATNAALVTLGSDNSGTSYPTLLSFEVPAASKFTHIDLGLTPMVFAGGIRVKTLTNCTITLITDKNSSGS